MSLQDPIADLFTRIRNGQSAKKVSVTMPKPPITFGNSSRLL